MEDKRLAALHISPSAKGAAAAAKRHENVGRASARRGGLKPALRFCPPKSTG